MLARKKELGLPEKISQSLPGSDLLILMNACETPQVPNPNNGALEHAIGTVSLKREVSGQEKLPTVCPKNIF